MTDAQRERLDIVLVLTDSLAVEIAPTDLVTFAHWISTGRNIYESAETELASDDAAQWAPAVTGSA